jgi:hypothetical protein
MLNILRVMELMLEGKKRSLVAEPMYKQIGPDGRVYIDKHLAGKFITVLPVEPVPDDIKYVKSRRSGGTIG